METPKIFEAVIIGAGIMGSSTAYYLSKKLGSQVALVEQFDLLNRRGSSHGDSRITRLTYPQEHYTFLMKTSFELWREAEVEAGTKVFTETGGLDFARKSIPSINSVIAAAKKWDIPHEVLTPSEVTSRFPTITLPEDYIAVYSPSSGVLKATKAVGMFQDLARKNGCNLLENTNITGIEVNTDPTNGSNIFEIHSTTHGIIRSKKCVITAGAWTQKVLDKTVVNSKPLNLKLPLNPIQVTVCYWEVESPEKYSGLNKTFPVFISYDPECRVYGTPALEFPLLKCCSHEGPDCDPDTRDFQRGDVEIDNVARPFVQKFFVGVTPEPVITESCMYTISPDEDYIIDKVPGVSGLYVGGGCSGHAFKMGPVIGTMLAGFVLNDENPFTSVAQHLSIGRF